MGWTVLYIAFGIVALWLLGEVLLQYKARLRWRLLAFTGFVGVVIGVLMPSVFVIVVGAIAFATGQTYVTLSFRRGFSTGWAIGGSPGASRRRRGAGADREPTLQVSDLQTEYDHEASPQPGTAPQAGPAAVYAPEPLPDDTGQYGIYTEPLPQQGQHQEPQQPQYAAYDPPYTDPAAYPAQDQDTYGGQDTYAGAGQYDYGTDQQQYAAYSDPYIGTTASTPQYGTYENYANENYANHGNDANDANDGNDGNYDSYGSGRQFADPYAPSQPYAPETPPGGVWVPQQREGEQYPPVPPEQPAQPAPYPNGYDTGYNEQYRY